MGRVVKLRPVDGDPEGAREVPKSLSRAVDRARKQPVCCRCGRTVDGAKQRYVLCEICVRADHDLALQRQRDIAEGKIPEHRYLMNGQWVDVYRKQPPRIEKDVTPPKPVPRALPPPEDEEVPFQ